MTIVIRHLGGYVEAMGHRVVDGAGAAQEVKRRCLATLSRCSSPPDEIRFLDLTATASGHPVGPGPVRSRLLQRA